MKMYSFVLILGLVFGASAVTFQIRNNAGGPIWVGILGNAGKPALANGGFKLEQNKEKSVESSDDWAGRFWARTWCDAQSNHCETGDCGNKLECNGNGGVPPATLVEITLRSSDDQDFYDVSLVDGFNVMASIEPVDGSGNCKAIKCAKDINTVCPNELQLVGQAAGYAIGCHSSCLKFNTDAYCCRGAYGTPGACSPNKWEVNSAKVFKDNCPDAYSYTYDDATITFTCKASKYKITFG